MSAESGLRGHLFELAGELGIVVVERAASRPRSYLHERRIVTAPIADVVSYYVALHELGHVVTDGPDTMASGPRRRREPRVVAARLLLGEARAWGWALDVALVAPDHPTQLHMLEAWTTYVLAGGGTVATAGIELVAAEHRGEYAATWDRIARNWTWEP